MNKFRLVALFSIALLIFKIMILMSIPYDAVTYLECRPPGIVAKHLIDGLIMPFSEYQNTSYDNSILFVGILVMPFFLVFGQSLFALHFVGILFAVGTFIGWCYFLYKYFDKRILGMFFVLYLFAPVGFSRFTVALTSAHHEVGLFMVLYLIQFFSIHFGETKKTNASAYAILGVIGAVGIWFAYNFGVVLAASFVCWFLLDKTFFLKRNFWIFLIILLGGAHKVLYDFFFKVDLFSELFTFDNPLTFNEAIRIFTEHIPNSMIFSHDYFTYGYYSAAILCFLYILKRVTKGVLSSLFQKNANPSNFEAIKIFSLVAYCLILFFAYFMCNTPETNSILLINEAHYRYIMSFYPFLLAIMALAIVKLVWSHKAGPRILGWILFCVPVTMSFTDHCLFMKLEQAKFVHEHPGYSYELMGSSLFENYSYESLLIAEWIDYKDRGATYRGVGYEVGSQISSEDGGKDFLKMRVNPSLDLNQYFYEGVVMGFAVEEYFHAKAPFYSEMADKVALRYLREDISKFNEYVHALDKPDRSNFYAGVGVQAVDMLLQGENIFVNNIPDSDKNDFYKGVGIGLQGKYIHSEVDVKVISNLFPFEYHEDIFAGIEICKNLLVRFE